MKSDFVCIDWGGSDITGFHASRGQLLKNFKISGGNLRILKPEQLKDICRQIINETGNAGTGSAVWLIGAAGADDTDAATRLKQALKELLPESDVHIYSDYVCNHAACLNGGDGILSVNGTGSILYAVIGDFRMRASGWGYVFDELPSGAYFGKMAIEGVLKFIEGDSRYGLFAEAFRANYGNPDRGQIIDCIYRSSSIQKQLGLYAPVLTNAFSAGCTRAEQIVKKSVTALAETVERLLDGHDQIVDFCGSGGLWKNWPVLGQLAKNEFSQKKLNLRFIEPQKPLQTGALLHFTRIHPEYKLSLETFISQETFNVNRTE